MKVNELMEELAAADPEQDVWVDPPVGVTRPPLGTLEVTSVKVYAEGVWVSTVAGGAHAQASVSRRADISGWAAKLPHMPSASYPERLSLQVVGGEGNGSMAPAVYVRVESDEERDARLDDYRQGYNAGYNRAKDEVAQ